jgi:hypothetical protein
MKSNNSGEQEIRVIIPIHFGAAMNICSSLNHNVIMVSKGDYSDFETGQAPALITTAVVGQQGCSAIIIVYLEIPLLLLWKFFLAS